MDKKQNKQFWKMKQADRIEYFLHKRDIEEKHEPQIYSFVSSMINLFFYILIVALLFYIAFDITSLFKIISPLLKVMLWAVVFVFIFDIVGTHFKHKILKRLNKKFKIKEVKPLWKRIIIME